MANILDYVDWRGDIKASVSCYNEIDYLILAQISYLNFDGLLKDCDFKEKISLFDLAKKFEESANIEERRDMGVLINPLTPKLFLNAARENRYKDIKITGYQSIIDLSKEEQFAAMTFILEDGTNVVAYRGTDDTIVGWKEDFNLAILDEVPAQKDAVDYLSLVSKKLTGSIIVTGHSKGGNLCIYAPYKSSDEVQKKVSGIYNFDGPGFTDERLQTEGFKKITDKIHSFYPQLSIVGMFFSNAGFYEVVESDQTGLMQHDPFSWHLRRDSFITTKDFDSASKFFHVTVNSWLNELDNERRDLFIETLFDLISVTDAKTNSEIESNAIHNSVKIIAAYTKLDPDLRKKLSSILNELFKAAQKKLPSLDALILKKIK